MEYQQCKNGSRASRHRYKHQRGVTHIVLLTVVVVLALLVATRLALPTLVKNYLNQQLATMGNYSGHINDVDLAIWRGAYTLNTIEVVKTDRNVPVTFFQSDSIDLSISWSAILRGAVVADVVLIEPELHFVDANDEKVQTGAGTDWRVMLQQLLPIKIDRLAIQQGELHFHNFQSTPPVHIIMTELNGEFTNITNSRDADSSAFSFKGAVLETAAFSMNGQLNPLAEFRDFDIKLKIEDVDVVKLNQLTEAYASFNMESGMGEFFMVLKADDGQLNGYARPVFDNVVILDLSKDSQKGIINVVWESVVAAVGQIFRNQPKDRIAAEIDISGSLDNENISSWQAFISILRNAFIEAYDKQFRQE
ncbi:MAG TPA: DUF748 domain-containing protein [Methylophaga aminisulfidivorans]|nr:DUF748 domain-containing protein [Methylophaga aminisulfidivorans]